MLIYIVRHAIAVPRKETGGLDHSDRKLTPKGIERMRMNVSALAQFGVRLDEIWASPFMRALQTAEILACMPSFSGSIRTVELLGPGGDLADLASELEARRDLKAIGMVGHEPNLGELAGLMLTGQPRSVLAFKKGGVACIELDGLAPFGKGLLRWMMTPKQMRSVVLGERIVEEDALESA